MVHPRRVVAVMAAALLLSVPVHAQEDASRVWFDGFGFAFAEDLAASVNITAVPGEDPDQEGTVLEPTLPGTLFSLYGSAQHPRIGGSRGELRLLPIDGLAGYAFASGKAADLARLLAERPGLDRVEGSLPWLPDVGAAQAIVARAQYVDAPQVSGIAWVTVFRQDVFPFAAADFTYLFLGISADGTQLVSLFVPLRSDLFPEEVSFDEEIGTARGWQRYITRSAATLEAAGPDAFSPSLTSIGALVESITFSDAPSAATSPAPSGG